ncbi:putative nuclear envelope pore membrane protein [Talaromyces proteolyticus]|uniref:Nuclear envelope pore membrane protein n=1 Tax=Talaromyces proteolyticus TaxID=1131652 RepID=A0AAD4KE71_9EURO|nr:putative nuclear envelope pore membrane protein [Talaromyces proteolyticus]KAH8688889.1 putative nuclear envelope pore membrane protein [Talaromyces proteolyticus]
MNGTPRLRSAFPQTPQTAGASRGRNASPFVPKLKDANMGGSQPALNNGGDGPLIPVRVVDAPSQRLYVAALYVALGAWRIYDSWGAFNELDSTWLFLKWGFIDGVFLFGIQALRIPWLEWTFPTFLTIFLLHLAANVFLMFRIPLPVGAWATVLFKSFYDRELSISERSVKPADIIHNTSLILGRQIIHILPEGSAVLNPDLSPLCLDTQHNSVYLPIHIYQSIPKSVEILRFDLSTGENETLSLQKKHLKQMKNQLEKQKSSVTNIDFLYEVKKPGIYRLSRVVDESDLDVQIKVSDTLINVCPRAIPKTVQSDRCKGDLSDITLEVEGSPPLKIKYSRKINGLDGGFSFQNIQSESNSPFAVSRKLSGLLIDSEVPVPVWAQSQKLQISLNESLNTGGDWIYAIEEVHDAYGNIANYSTDNDDSSGKGLLQWHQLSVHERPRLSLLGCNAQKFLKIAKGVSTEFPLHFHSTGKDYSGDTPMRITYSYSNSEEWEPSKSLSNLQHMSLKNLDNLPKIKEPGWYSLDSKIFDKCANNSVGLLVDLDLVGSPPFRLRYAIDAANGPVINTYIVDGLRGQLDFTPTVAGYYRYRFLDISDSIYERRDIQGKVPILEQDVKPPASAQFQDDKKPLESCFGESVSLDVLFAGESPWLLQYEIAHNGKKTKHELQSDDRVATITTGPLLSGGEHVISLTSVTDRSNCKRVLKEDFPVQVRPKKPRAGFGMIDEKRTVLALQNSVVELPLRLSGQAPWRVKYRNMDSNSAQLVVKKIWDENGVISVSQNGRYELVEVFDETCPGSIDQSASTFEIDWLPRPSVSLSGRTGVEEDVSKRSVCQGDDDILELKLAGRPPFNVKYEHYQKGDHGTSAVKKHNLKSVSSVTSLVLDTTKPGDYFYEITDVSDYLYDFDPKGGHSIKVAQTVNALPSARFESPGHIYAFCKEDSDGDELIPIVLEGQPPFYLDISIKHHSSSKPEIVSVGPIKTNKHRLPIPRRHLELGQHVVSIHRVGDSRGCQRTFDRDLSSVRVAVSDVPTIIPLESQSDYCVGERLSFSLSGHAPFEVFYTFNGIERKATSHSTTFKRIAEQPGQFTITAVSDSASGRCQAHKNISKIIHEMPSVKISKGRESVVDIHEGGEAEMSFEFWGTPPFEFTYTRSSNARRGEKPEILDIKHDVSYEHKKTIKISDEGTYEVVSIKDKYCSFSTHQPSGKVTKQTRALQN